MNEKFFLPARKRNAGIAALFQVLMTQPEEKRAVKTFLLEFISAYLSKPCVYDE